MSLNNHIHSVYSGDIKNSKPIQLNRLGHTLKDIKCPDPETIKTIQAIRIEEDPTKKATLKTRLRSYTPAVVCHNQRKYDDIISFSGLLALDFDKLPNAEYSIEFKAHLFHEYPFIYATWLSASGLGVRGLVHIPIAKSTDHFKSIFNAIEQDFGIYDGFDSAPKNAVLPLFQSYDPDMLYRKSAEQYERTYYPPEPPKQTPIPILSDDRATQRIINIVTSAINKINDNGHPQLRGASYALGGYVAAGYIAHDQAISLIDRLIELNAYLSIKPAVYKQTARTMIIKGQSQPLYL